MRALDFASAGGCREPLYPYADLLNFSNRNATRSLSVLGSSRQLDQCTGHHFEPEAAIEIRVVRDDEHDPAQHIIDGAVINAVTGDHLIVDAGNGHDLRWDGRAGIFEPLPGASKQDGSESYGRHGNVGSGA